MTSIEEALRYPMNHDNWIVTVLIGGALSLFSFLIVPILIVYGYLLRVIRTSIDGQSEPPVFEDWGELIVEGFKAAVIVFVYMLIPLIVGAVTVGGSIAAIGVFYGIDNAVVGWLTHEFHSAVFAFVFAGLVSLAPARYRDSALVAVGAGIAWGVILWVVAAGFVAPFWLRLLGIPAAVPTFSPELLVSHLLWGGSLGALTAWGNRYVAPWLARHARWSERVPVFGG